MSKYATKADLKNATDVNTSDSDVDKSDVDKLDIYKLKNVLSNLINLKSKVDKLDVDKLVPVLVDLSRLSKFGKMMLLKILDSMNWLQKLTLFRLLILLI